MFQGDALLLDMYLTKLEVSEGLFDGYKELLIESNTETATYRETWSGYEEGAFDKGCLESLDHAGLVAVQTLRRRAYIKNLPDKIKEYQRHRDS